jgi:hypothetical protein
LSAVNTSLNRGGCFLGGLLLLGEDVGHVVRTC